MSDFLEKHNLVWHSTPASIEAGKTSLLAALETVLFVAAWWYAYFNGWFTWWTIGLGLISSVIVLMRCDESEMEGLKRFGEYGDLRAKNKLNSFYGFVEIIIIVPFVILCIRMYSSLSYFIASFKNIPKNWKNLIWSLDLYHSPELLPKSTRINEFFSVYAIFKFCFAETRKAKAKIVGKIANCIFILFATLFSAIYFFLLCLPPLLYRFAIKSTAWLWFPLIYIQRGVSLIETKPFIDKYELINERKNLWYNWLLRGYSFVFLVFVVISVIFPQFFSKTYMPYALFFGFFENYHPSWFQLLGFILAVLNLVIFFKFIDPLYLHVKTEEDFKRHEGKFKTLITLLRVSNVLFLLTIFLAFISFMFFKANMPLHLLPDYAIDFMNWLLVKPINLKFWY